MTWKKQVVSGSSARTGSAVIQAGRKPDTSLLLPETTDLTTIEGLRKLNERFDQIERALRAPTESEISLAVKFGYGALGSVPTDLTPVPGAKVNLDKQGNWLLLVTFDWSGSGTAEGCAVVDPEATGLAKRQDAVCKTSTPGTTTAWSMFTATEIPRLAQLYAKSTGGTWAILEGGTSLCAIWLGTWEPGDKRFGRQMESTFSTASDMNGDALTDHGEEARWPSGDHPDVLPEGVALPTL